MLLATEHSLKCDLATIRHLVEDQFLASVFSLSDNNFFSPGYNHISNELVFLSYYLIKMGKIKARNVVRRIENTPTISLKPYIKKFSILSERLSRDHNFCKNTFESFAESTEEEARGYEEAQIELSYRPTHASFDEKAVVNLTDLWVPDDILLILSFGPKFCLPAKNNVLNTVEFLDDFLSHLEYSFPIETHLEACKQTVIEFNHQHRFTNTRAVWLDFLHYRLNAFLQAHPNLLITRSDKGKHTVLIFKETYFNKMRALVESTNDYVLLDDFSVKNLEDKNNRFVKILISRGTITQEDAYLYRDSTCFVAQLYGLIKIHKVDKPVRPIVSACAAPGFKLAKLFTSILSKVFFEEGFHIKDSMSLVERLKGIRLTPTDTMISCDVVSMFTNLPIDLLISIIQTKEHVFRAQYHLNFDTLKSILIFILKDCAVFSWNKTFYKQRDSLAMGSPLSPILARILMTHLIDKTLVELGFRPKFLALYVDDSLWIVDSSQISVILHKLNAYHPKIKFTVERETNGSLDFLDVSVIRDSSELITRWRAKPFASDRLLNYFSHHERTCIFETAKAFIRRVLSLSDGRFFHENKAILERILRANSFPETELIGLLRENYTFMTPLTSKTKYSGTYVPIKFRGDFTARLKHKIHPFLTDARLVGTPDRSDSKHFSFLKDSIELKNKTNGVLILTCVCKAKKILRHTEYGQRVEKLLTDLESHTFGPSACTLDAHSFSGCQFLQCRNFSSAKRKFELLAYHHRTDLIDTKYNLPIFKIASRHNGLKISTK